MMFGGTLVTLRSNVVRIGRWSVLIPGVLVNASQVMIESMWSSDIKTWSSLVHFFDFLRYIVHMGGDAWGECQVQS